MKNTFVISAFPGSGKSYCYTEYKDELLILDSDSSEFSWVKDKEGNNTSTRNPEFPQNYIEHIKRNIGKVDVIFVSSHDIVRKALHDNNIETILIYPDNSMKSEFIERYVKRGNAESFINFISSNWDKFISEIDEEDYGFMKIKLDAGTPYIDLKLLNSLSDNSMGNLCSMWSNKK